MSKEPFSVESGPVQGVNDLKIAALIVALSYKKPRSEGYNKYLLELKDLFSENGQEVMGEPEPFYREEEKSRGDHGSPAGYFIKTTTEDGRKKIYGSFAGTRFSQWYGQGRTQMRHHINVRKSEIPFGKDAAGEDVYADVHKGYDEEYMDIRDDMFAAFDAVGHKMGDQVDISGHSLGGAVSQLASLDLQSNFDIHIKSVISFGSPRVFSKQAAFRYNEVGLGAKTLRINQGQDPVPSLVPKSLGFYSVGNKVMISDSTKGIHVNKGYKYATDNIITQDMIKNYSLKPGETNNSFISLYLLEILTKAKELLDRILSRQVKKIKREASPHLSSLHTITQSEGLLDTIRKRMSPYLSDSKVQTTMLAKAKAKAKERSR